MIFSFMPFGHPLAREEISLTEERSAPSSAAVRRSVVDVAGHADEPGRLHALAPR